LDKKKHYGMHALELDDYINFYKMGFSSSRTACEIVTDIRGLISPIIPIRSTRDRRK